MQYIKEGKIQKVQKLCNACYSLHWFSLLESGFNAGQDYWLCDLKYHP